MLEEDDQLKVLALHVPSPCDAQEMTGSHARFDFTLGQAFPARAVHIPPLPESFYLIGRLRVRALNRQTKKGHGLSGVGQLRRRYP